MAGLRLGRKPFQAALKLFLEDIKGSIAESTWKETRKKLNFEARVFEELKREGEVKTTDPRHMNKKDINAFRGWLKAENYDPQTQKKMLSELKKLLEHHSNYVFEDLKRESFRMLRDTEKPIKTFKEDDLWKILDSTEHLENKWHGQLMRGALALYWATMRRPSEIRLCRVYDLDIKGMTLHIEFPKGAGSWAGPTDIAIVRSDMVPYLKQYLQDRENHLKENGLEKAEALFPNVTQGPNSYYSLSRFNYMKRKVEAISGVNFTIKEIRASSATDALDKDPTNTPLISALGHKDPSTTPRYYARVNAGRAGEELRARLDKSKANEGPWQHAPQPGPTSSAIDAKKPVIPGEFPPSGYA